jgi:hypothetical protein
MTIEYFRLDNLQWINNRFNLSTEKKIFRSSKNKTGEGRLLLFRVRGIAYLEKFRKL